MLHKEGYKFCSRLEYERALLEMADKVNKMKHRKLHGHKLQTLMSQYDELVEEYVRFCDDKET